MNYYNEFDHKAAAWLRELISAGHIPPGDVDERSITEVRPHELESYTQCHFFAGIGGWSLALRMAGWPDDRAVWTGSCPCQPFSESGKGLGTADERHLWPAFFALIDACRPTCLFGEQVASAAVVGSSAKPSKRKPAKPLEQVWLDGVFADLESSHYACGAADIPAAGIGAPHRRQRLYWVANANGRRFSERRELDGDTTQFRLETPRGDHAGRCGEPCGLAHAERDGGRADEPQWQSEGRVADGRSCGLADMQRPGLEGLAGDGYDRNESRRERADAIGSVAEGGGARDGRMADTKGDDGRRKQQPGESTADGRRGFTGSGAWSDFDIIPCRDGKARRIESGTFPLAHGVSNRVGLLRGYGNAIVPALAAEFIQACEEALIDLHQ